MSRRGEADFILYSGLYARVCVCVHAWGGRGVKYLSVYAGHRAPGHGVGHVPVLVYIVVQQVLEATVAKFEQFV